MSAEFEVITDKTFTISGARAMATITVPSSSFVFSGGNAALFTIKPDGTIERGPNFTTEDEMSLAFWEKISEAFPAFREAVKKSAT